MRRLERKLRVMHWVVKLVSAWGVCTCVHEPMLDTRVDTYMLHVIYMCAACECVRGCACVFWICIRVACLYAQNLYVCFLRGSMHFLFLIPLVPHQRQPSPSRGVGDTLPAPFSPTCPPPRR